MRLLAQDLATQLRVLRDGSDSTLSKSAADYFREGAEGLAALVRETMATDPFSGAMYVFRAKRAG